MQHNERTWRSRQISFLIFNFVQIFIGNFTALTRFCRSNNKTQKQNFNSIRLSITQIYDSAKKCVAWSPSVHIGKHLGWDNIQTKHPSHLCAYIFATANHLSTSSLALPASSAQTSTAISAFSSYYTPTYLDQGGIRGSFWSVSFRQALRPIRPSSFLT